MSFANLKIPPGKTEAEVLAAIAKTTAVLAPGFVFGFFGVEDIRQQAHLFAFEALEREKYDVSRPLENFLYTHIRNQLLNLKRKLMRRSDSPCDACHGGALCTGAQPPAPCKKYRVWMERNQAKSNLLLPLELLNISDEHEINTRVDSTVQIDAEIDESLRAIDEHLPMELRSAYLQMRAGVAVPKAKRLAVENAVLSILKGAFDRCPSELD